jgi:UDP-N-acetylglucosamine 3-dehydrogenase
MTRLAVIGVGAMGRSHARVAHELSNVELVGVSDVDEQAAARVAERYGTACFADHAALLDQANPDGVIVAVPTSAHFAVVRDVLAAGCHVLVEKPIAATLDEAMTLAKLGQAAGRVLAVGHIERFNPAITELRRRLAAGDLGRVIQVHARRLGPFPDRIRDVGVIIDLATHDLDIMRFLTGSEAVRVYAETRRQINTSREDLMSGLVRFADDTMGLLEINWLTPTKIRELFLTGERGMFRVDYLTQDIYFYENAEAGLEWSPLSVMRGVSEGSMTRFAIHKVEPLRAELEAFVRAIRDGDQGATVNAADGVAALRLALALIKAGEEHRPVDLR